MTFSTERLWQRLFRARAEDTLPHTIAHQRIYIVPTARGAAFLLAIVLMLIASINYSLSLGYALSFLLTGLFAATLLHTYRNLAGITIRSISGDDVFAGEKLPFTVTLSNDSKEDRHGIRLSTRSNINARSRLKGLEQAQVVLHVPTESRGSFALGRLTLQSDWPLGLWTCWSYLHAPVHSVIFPQPEVNPPPLPSHSESGSGDQQATANQGDVAGLRDYIPGDSIGSIAWKSAAKGAGLQVRTFDEETAPAQAVLNLQKTGKHHLEEQLARLCAWVLQAESTRADYAVELPGQSITSGTGDQHRNTVLTALALHGTQS